MLLRGRHHRRLPGRVARADGDAAAAEADEVLRPRRARWRSSGPGRSSGRWCIPYLNRRAGREPVHVSRIRSLEPILKRTLGVPLFQEQLLRMAMVAAGFTGGQAEELRRAMGFKRSEKRMKQIEVQLREGMARNGITGDAAEQIVTVDRVVRALRISRVARRQLCAAGLRERVSQGALPGGVLHGAAQQPADGVLPSVDAGQGRAAPRRPLSSDRRAGLGLGLHGRSRTARSASACATSAACAKQVGQRDRQRRRCQPAHASPPATLRLRCPKCGCDDPSMLEPRGRGEVVLQQLLARLDAAPPRAARSVRSTSSSRAPACAATSW